MRKLAVLFIGIIVALVAFFIWWQNGMSSPDPNNTEEKIFVINRGAAIRQVGNDLKEQGFIKDPVTFFLYIKKEGIETSIQAGSYKLSPSMTLPQVLDVLQHGTVDVWVTIPEGYRAEQIAEVLEESIPSYDESWIATLKNNEGYLFPDTYLIPQEADVDGVVNIMRANFNQKIESIGLSDSSPNLEDVVIIASLIEREAITDDEKYLISSVIQNRLDSGMGLDIDATWQYIVGKKGDWWPVPTGNERQIDSLYNTYRYAGLPPGPISNPGLTAIEAALKPQNSPYFFYIHDSSGAIHFSETLDEHNDKVNRYLR